jgi:hypothetical protein
VQLRAAGQRQVEVTVRAEAGLISLRARELSGARIRIEPRAE